MICAGGVSGFIVAKSVHPPNKHITILTTQSSLMITAVGLEKNLYTGQELDLVYTQDNQTCLDGISAHLQKTELQGDIISRLR